MPELNIIEKKILRGYTNDLEHAKHYFLWASMEGMATSLLIKKLVLTAEPKMYYDSGYKFRRKYKGRYLVETFFSMKLTTFDMLYSMHLEVRWPPQKVKF